MEAALTDWAEIAPGAWTPGAWLPIPSRDSREAMRRYTLNTDKRHAQPAYRRYTPTGLTRTPLQSPRVHAAASHNHDSIVLDPAPPDTTQHSPYDRRDQYPPCPHCGEPVITVWTFGPEMHNADPCGCALTEDEVKHFAHRGGR